MKPNHNELYEQWVERARLFELDMALKKLKSNENIEEIMNVMSYRMYEKFKYPIFEIEYEQFYNEYDPKASFEHYQENYINKYNRRADHVIDK